MELKDEGNLHTKITKKKTCFKLGDEHAHRKKKGFELSENQFTHKGERV